MLVRRPGLLVLASVLACTVTDPSPPPREFAPRQSAPPQLAPIELEPASDPVLTPASDPVLTPAFDPATATAIRARIVSIPNRKSWVPCGIHHCVGVLEVEVLDVGEPPPRMLLFVSCPADRRQEPRLEVGATIAFGLHARKQSWPSVGGLAKDLPRRYVKSIARVEAALPG